MITEFSKMHPKKNECLSLKTFQRVVHYGLHISVYNVLCYRTSFLNFVVSLTVHLSIILVTDQLNAPILAL